MKIYAARYYSQGNRYDVVVYRTRREADKHPHDWWLWFSPSQWRRTGCRVPGRDETMAVEMTCKEVAR